MKKYFLLTVPILLLIASCKKKEFPQNITEEPTFYLNATVDGNPVNIKAGMLGYYMYSSYAQDSNNLYSFVAEVKPSNCNTTCNNSLKFEINDDQLTTANGNSDISNSLKVGSYLFNNSSTNYTPTLVGYSVQFKSSFNKTATGYDWDFGDGGPHSTMADPTHTFATAGIKNICLSIKDGSTTTTICNPVKVTISPVAVQSHVSTLVSGNTVSFTAHTSGGTGPYNYVWDFGDQSPLPPPDPNVAHTYSTSNRYLTSYTVTDVYGDPTSFNYYVNTDLSDKPAPNYNVASINALYATSVTAMFSKVKITYTDNTGITYYSNLQSQISGNSSFQIISVEDYKANEKNQATKKIKISFSCKLYNGNTSVDLKNGEAVLAVSYK